MSGLNQKYRIASFSLFFLFFVVLVDNFEWKEASLEPGWAEQYSAMKNIKAVDNYYGIRNLWARQEALRKKSTGFLDSIQEMGPYNVAGRVRALLIDRLDSSHIFAGGVSGGLWVSFNGGKSWKVVDDYAISMAVTCITQNPFNPLEIYYGTGESTTGNSANIDGAGVFKSIDGGKSFKQLSSTASDKAFSAIWDIEFSKTRSSTLYVGVNNGGLFRSVDNGNTFECVFMYSKAIHEIETFKDGTLWAGFEGVGITATKEADELVFKRVLNGLPNYSVGRISLSVCELFPQIAFCQILNTDGKSLVGIYKTTNNGHSWKQIPSPPASMYFFGWYCLNTKVNPYDSNMVLVAGVTAFVSLNGGASWKKLSQSHADFHTTAFMPSGKNFLVGNDGGVYNYNATSLFNENVSLNNGLNITQFYTGAINPLDSKTFMGGTQDNGTQLYDGTNFKPVMGGDGSYCAYSSTPPYYNYLSSQNGNINRFEKDFTGETRIILPNNYVYWFINPFEINAQDGNKIYVLTKYRIMASEYAGESWSWVEFSDELYTQVLSLGVSNQINPILYFGGPNTVFYRATSALRRETNLSYSAPFEARNSVINCIKVSKNNPGTVYISMSDINTNPRVWRLNEADVNIPRWTNISGNLPVSLPVNCIEVNDKDSNKMLAGTDFGVFTTSNGGTNWHKETAIPNVAVFKIESDPVKGIVYIFTHGRGIFKAQFRNVIPEKINPPSQFIFNNPVERMLKISKIDQTNFENLQVYFYNTLGALVLETKASSSLGIDLTRFSKGIYIMSVIDGKKVYDFKVLKL